MGNEEFQNWWTKIGNNSLFFDGAFKGNPWLASASRVIFDSKGNKQKEYAWDIGRVANNGT